MAERRLEFLESYDWIRKSLMFEPRGHDMMSGAFLYPAKEDRNDVGILFIETSGCLPMCGHGTIGTITMGIEEGLIKPQTQGIVKAEVPAGELEIKYEMEDGKVTKVTIENVPSFLFLKDVKVDVDGMGEIKLDISYGGNFYAIVEPQKNFQGLNAWDSSQLIHYSRSIRQAVNNELSIVHPLDKNIQGLSHVLWAEEPSQYSKNYRNAVFYGDKAIDRSPCGTGTSARMAQLYSRGKLKVGEDFIHESIIGSTFNGKILREERISDDHNGIKPLISGWAIKTGENKIIVDPKDPFWEGFQVK